MRRSSAALAFALFAAAPAHGFAAPPAAPELSPKLLAGLEREKSSILAKPGIRYVGFYEFVIDHTGHVLDDWVALPSGSATLDRMALATIRKAVLKRLPANAPPTLKFVIPIAFHKNGAMSRPSP